jgi:hypothetical protein
MKKQLLGLISFITFGFTTSAQCEIASNCTPSGNGYCTVPANNATLQPVGEVGIAYSSIIQFNTDATFGGAPINSVTIEPTTLPPGLTIEFNPEGNSADECFIIGGQAGCATISGIPTLAGNQQSVELSLIADVGGNIVPLTANFFIDVNESTASFINYYSEIKLILSPNPSNSDVQISVFEPSDITIYDVSGKIIQNLYLHSQTTINTFNWEKGIYFFRSTEHGETVKFIKN